MSTQRKIIGVDFDDTIFKHSYPADDSEPNWSVINYLKEQKASGAYIILVTCRHQADDLRFAIEASRKVGIEYDAVNANMPFMIEKLGDCRKIFCNEYIDDKNKTIAEIESEYEPDCSNDGSQSENIALYVDKALRALCHEMKSNDPYQWFAVGPEAAKNLVDKLIEVGEKVSKISIKPDEWDFISLARFLVDIVTANGNDDIDIDYR